MQRRNNAKKVPQTAPSVPSTKSAKRANTMAAAPTYSELLLLSIYPTTLVLGSLFSLLSPETRNGLYDPMLQSFPAEVAPSYFARKSNLFNRYFVKIGWFWVTLAFTVFTITRVIRRTELNKLALGTQRVGRLPPALQSLLRWVVATSWWFGVTQWCFGPALIDRGFRWTGGQCHAALAKGPNDMVRNAEIEQLVTAAACKAMGGAWHGGHDISGHVFLLVLGSAFLSMEILPTVLRSISSEGVGNPAEKNDARAPAPSFGEYAASWATWFAGTVGLMCLWMLLMTAAYFHTWFEKFTGLTVAYMGIASIYSLPRYVPALRPLLGAPVL